MANSSSLKNRYAFTSLLFLFLFLLSIFLFTKRALEPSISLYRDLFTSSTDSTVVSDSIIAAPDLEPIDSSGRSFVSPISRTEKVDYESGNGGGSEEKRSFQDDEKITGVDTSGDNVDPSVSRITQSQTVESNGIVDILGSSVSFEEGEKKGAPAGNDTIDTLGDNVDSSTRLPVEKISQSQRAEPDNAAVKTINKEEVPVEEDKEVPFNDKESVSTSGINDFHTMIENMKNCDLYVGTWVKDDEYPLYKPDCPYVDEAFDCQRNGRPDSEYLKWRWKPDGCSIPRFNATDFLERLRGRRLMLVGDSMNRNQFESMICLLRGGLHDKSRMYEIHGHKITKGRGYFEFKFTDFDCTVAFVRSHFLVKEGVRYNAQGRSNPTLSIDRIDKTYGRWKRADILVFNTGHWWVHGKTSRGVNYYKEGDYLYPKFDSVEAYRRALRTWAKWIRENVNPKKQLVFYRGYSSAHFRGGDWDSGGSCKGETDPVLSGSILDSYPEKMKIVEEVIQEMQVPVILLNVTRLTNFRKDGHPSIYGKSLTEGKKVSRNRQDCSHWCLPGVPDAWNELIYASLVIRQTT